MLQISDPCWSRWRNGRRAWRRSRKGNTMKLARLRETSSWFASSSELARAAIVVTR